MKRITLTFMILLSVFFTIWGVKMKHPINRPENVKEDTETPWYETKYQAPKADDEWTLDPEIPLNYIPVFIDLNADDSIVRNIQPQFKTEEEPVINENTETDLEK